MRAARAFSRPQVSLDFVKYLEESVWSGVNLAPSGGDIDQSRASAGTAN